MLKKSYIFIFLFYPIKHYPVFIKCLLINVLLSRVFTNNNNNTYAQLDARYKNRIFATRK